MPCGRQYFRCDIWIKGSGQAKAFLKSGDLVTTFWDLLRRRHIECGSGRITRIQNMVRDHGVQKWHPLSKHLTIEGKNVQILRQRQSGDLQREVRLVHVGSENTRHISLGYGNV